MTYFSGLCIGGPSAGKRMVSQSPVLEFAVMRPLRWPQYDMEDPVATHCEKAVYHHTPGFRTPDEGVRFDFWVYEGLSREPYYLMNVLFDAYTNLHSLKAPQTG